MNEETIIENRPTMNGQNESKNQSDTWKKVTLGGVSGFLMGAGLLYAGQAVAATKADASEETGDAATAEAQQAGSATEATLPVAQMHNEMSFGEAFAAARAEVGPGGVFIWHGGIYNTYTEDEWNAMTPQQKNEFAHQVNPEVRAHEVPTPTDAHPDVAVHHVAEPAAHPTANTDDVQVVDQPAAAESEQGGDVHIVGYANVQGHLAVGYDTDNDGQADVAIIDVDDDQKISEADVIMDNQGHAATVGELAATANDQAQMASMENPDVAPDMPDYMNDADMGTLV